MVRTAVVEVFLCWSGHVARDVAQKLNDWLPCVIQPVRPWYSEEIARGERWNTAVAQHLERSDFGIICLTPAATVSPWVMFEAGALAKSFDSGRGGAVAPLLIGVAEAEVPPPLTAFQTTHPTREGVWRLVRAIDARLPEAQRVRRLDTVFEAFWPDLGAALDDAVEAAASEEIPARGDSGQLGAADASATAVLDELLRRSRNASRHLAEIRDLIVRSELDQLAAESSDGAARRAIDLLRRASDPIDEGDDPWDAPGEHVLSPYPAHGTRRAADIVYVLEPLGLHPHISIDRPIDGEEWGADSAGSIDVSISASSPLPFEAGADVLRRIGELGFKERLTVRHVDEDGELVVHERPPSA